jgi:hypothetical protein
MTTTDLLIAIIVLLAIIASPFAGTDSRLKQHFQTEKTVQAVGKRMTLWDLGKRIRKTKKK